MHSALGGTRITPERTSASSAYVMLLNQRSGVILIPPPRAAQICPPSVEIWSSSARACSIPAPLRPFPSQIWPELADFGPNSFEFWQTWPRIQPNIGRTRTEFGRFRANSGRFPTNFGRHWLNSALGQSRLNFSRTLANFGRHRQSFRAELSNILPNLARVRPTSTEPGKIGPDSAKFGCLRTGLARFGQTPACILNISIALVPERDQRSVSTNFAYNKHPNLTLRLGGVGGVALYEMPTLGVVSGWPAI